MKFQPLLIRLKMALDEDGAFHDITSAQMPGFHTHNVTARLEARASGIFCGAMLIKPLFHLLDRHVQVRLLKKDGERVKNGDLIAVTKAKTRAILGGERTLLNIICHLSGVATPTSRFVQAARGSKVIITDTRKTTPLWRDLEKYAVTCGGGVNHRMNLSQAIMVKDNHFQYLRSIQASASKVFEARQLKESGQVYDFLEFEAENIKEVWEGIKARADLILLDNMDKATLKKSIRFIQAARRALNSDKPGIEVSGGITLKNIQSLGKLSVDRIAVGALTHSAPALDLSLEVN